MYCLGSDGLDVSDHLFALSILDAVFQSSFSAPEFARMLLQHDRY